MKGKFLAILLVVIVAGGLGLFFWQKNKIGGGSFRVSKTEERKLIALGDSLTKANNLSSDKVGDHEEYSFSTGTKINSVYQYWKNKGENFTPLNLASSGSTSRDILEKQVPNATSYHPKYITLMTGGPDILTGTSINQYRENLIQIVSQIKKDDTIVLLATNPNIAKMRTASYPSCQENKIGMPLTNLTQEKIREYNQVVKEVAQKNNLILIDLFETLGSEDVSDYDCLHPNVGGQEKIAAEFIKVLENK